MPKFANFEIKTTSGPKSSRKEMASMFMDSPCCPYSCGFLFIDSRKHMHELPYFLLHYLQGD